MWDKSPYPVIFQTVDAVVEAAGHILMIERRNIPGKGLWALPGGYLNVNEHLQDGMLRELDEETKIDLSRETLKRCITEHKRYDDPNRSERGRLITEAYHIELSAMDGKGNIRLPKIRQKALKHDEVDDAAKKRWIPLKEVKQMRDKIFEDHFSILEDMLGFSEEFVYGR
jgi:bifunctional NMN adenylyltransferase/nudix hydrolase